MIDGIIKQTGNSRYLKSAITEATSWEQFRAALIAGTLPIDLNGINAAGWQTLATALNKNTLLSDTVAAAIFGDSADHTISDALGEIITWARNMYRPVKVSVVAGSTPVPGVKISGITDLPGNDVYTDYDGIAYGFAAGDTTTLSVTSDYIDIGGSVTVSTPQGTPTVITLQAGKSFIKLTGSQSIKFSSLCTRVDVTSVGGGGGGANGYASSQSAGGGGGGGGYCVAQTNVTFLPDTLYAAVIGAGGAGGAASGSAVNAGGAGGTTSVLGISASGGNGGEATSMLGGTGNGAGGGHAPTGDVSPVTGSVDGYDSATSTVKYGGGGGMGAMNSIAPTGQSGAGYGAAGGNQYYSGGAAENGYGGGGGGGSYGLSHAGGSGGSGCVALRMHH